MLRKFPQTLDFTCKILNNSLWNSGCYSLRPMLSESQGITAYRGVQVSVFESETLRDNSSWEMLSLEEALTCLERMPQSPSVENFTFILQKCRQKKHLAYTQRLHAYMCKSGLEGHKSLANYLVLMFVEVGSLHDAQQVFDRLGERNVYSWNSLIIGYVECGKLTHAFDLYQKMQEDHVHPSECTFVALLKACARLKDAHRGQELHADIARRGLLERDVVVGNTLVDMYAKCGCLAKAREVFDQLGVRDVVSWTTLIAGYAKHGLGEEALDCFEQMQSQGVCPNAVTFVCSLKACGSIESIHKGREMHAHIARKGLERDLVVGSTLVDMYAKCDSLSDSLEVFDKLPARDIVSWNALIAGYAKHGLGDEALKCFQQMQLEGLSPDAVTFVCSLKACGSIGALQKGQEIHANIARRGLERDLVIGNTLLDMYAKWGLFPKAWEVFNKLPVRDVVSWNALVAAYTEHAFDGEAINCFEQMQLEGISPNAITFVCSLKACGTKGKCQEMHAEIARQGLLERDVVVGNALVDGYAKCGSLAKAQEVFDKLPVRDDVSWNTVIAAYTEHGFGERALNCFKQMQLEGGSPNAVTFICSLKACASIGAIDKGQEIHAEISRKGLERDLVVGSSLVDMYAKCNLLARAREVLDQLPARDVVSWTALIAAYAEHGLSEEALGCFKQMELEGTSPNVVTYVCSLKACGSLGAIDKGQEIHAEIARRGLESDLVIGNGLVDLYAKCGWLAKAEELFEKLLVRDLVSWTALIAGYTHLGESEKVFHILERMGGEGIKPDRVIFLSVLTVCSHTGLVENGQKYFDVMSKDYEITPMIEHYTCIIDLFGRAGQLDMAVAMMKKMPFDPDLVVWHTVLGACRNWSNVELGRQAFAHALQLDENDAATYVFMFNIMADADHMQD